MLPFPFGEDLPSQAQKTHCQQSRIVHVAAFALSNSGESERYLCYLMLSLIFISLNYLGVAPPFSRWQLEIRSSKACRNSSRARAYQPPIKVYTVDPPVSNAAWLLPSAPRDTMGPRKRDHSKTPEARGELHNLGDHEDQH